MRCHVCPSDRSEQKGILSPGHRNWLANFFAMASGLLLLLLRSPSSSSSRPAEPVWKREAGKQQLLADFHSYAGRRHHGELP